jgi:hypothetical protein
MTSNEIKMCIMHIWRIELIIHFLQVFKEVMLALIFHLFIKTWVKAWYVEQEIAVSKFTFKMK